MRRLAFVLLVAVGTAQAAAPVPDAEFAVRWTGHAYVSRHVDLVEAAASLHTAAQALCTAPSDEAVAGARTKWIEAMRAWRRMDGAPAAPAVLARTGRLIDFRPARVKDVEARIARGEGADPNNVAVRGLGVAEYLLWGDGQPGGQRTALADSARCAYLQGVVARIAEDVAAAGQGWEELLEKFGGEVDFPRRNLIAEQMGFMLGGLDGLARRIPQVREARTEAWPDWRSGSTRSALEAQLEGFAQAWFGPAERPDASLSAFLRGNGYGQADAGVRAALAQAHAALRQLPEGVPAAGPGPAHRHFLDTVAALRRSVEEVAARLDLVLGFNDSDGD